MPFFSSSPLTIVLTNSFVLFILPAKIKNHEDIAKKIIKNTLLFEIFLQKPLAIQKKTLPLHPHFEKMRCENKTLGYGVMVTLQILVLSFLVRVRVPQQKMSRVQKRARDISFLTPYFVKIWEESNVFCKILRFSFFPLFFFPYLCGVLSSLCRLIEHKNHTRFIRKLSYSRRYYDANHY